MKSNGSSGIVSDPNAIANQIQIQSTHLSAFLATMGCKPIMVNRGPERTAQGNPIAKWVFDVDDKLREIVKMWANPNAEAADWEQMTYEQREIVINIVNAFSDNLKHFLSDAKREAI